MTPDDKPSFILRRIIWADGQPSLDPEDYSVRENERDVGRIYHTTGGAVVQHFAGALDAVHARLERLISAA
jgi:hypothetical protein